MHKYSSPVLSLCRVHWPAVDWGTQPFKSTATARRLGFRPGAMKNGGKDGLRNHQIWGKTWENPMFNFCWWQFFGNSWFNKVREIAPWMIRASLFYVTGWSGELSQDEIWIWQFFNPAVFAQQQRKRRGKASKAWGAGVRLCRGKRLQKHGYLEYFQQWTQWTRWRSMKGQNGWPFLYWE